MCDPLTIAGIALSGASVAANSIAQGKVARARDDALAAERVRQSGLDREADALNARSQDRYENFNDQQADRSTSLGDYFTEQSMPTDTANASASLPTSSSNVTVQEEGKQRAKVTAATDAQGRALGELRAFGDVLGGIGRQQARDAGQIAQLGGFKRGSSSITPFELKAANEKGAGMRFLGDVLGGAGSLGVSAGLGGGTLPGFGAGGISVSGGVSAAAPRPGRIPVPTARPVGLGKLY